MKYITIFLPFLFMVGLSLSTCRSSAKVSEKHPGQAVFQNSCQSCHALPNPKMKLDEEWPAIVSRYGILAGLSGEKIKTVTEFLIASN